MMRIVYFADPIGDGELQLVRPQTHGLAFWRKAQARPEVEEDIRGLRDQKFAGFEKRRRERRMFDRAVFHQAHHRRHAARGARHIDVVGARVFEGEANEFTAALDRRPVIKFVAHDKGPPKEIGRREILPPRSTSTVHEVAPYFGAAALRRPMAASPRGLMARSIATLSSAGLPAARARSSAGRRSSGRSTNSP